MKKNVFWLCIALALAGFSALAEDKGYNCFLHVGSSSSDQKTSDDHKRGNGRSGSKSRTVATVVSWPVKVSLRGKSLPSPNAVKLKYCIIGETDGRSVIMEEKKLSVSLDAHGDYKTVISSPTAKIVHTTTVSRTRNGGRRNGNRRNRSTNVKTSSSGTRVTGCIVQLVVNGEVERCYASDFRWRKLAKINPLPLEDVLKAR